MPDDLRMKFIGTKTHAGIWCAAALHLDSGQFFVLNRKADKDAKQFALDNGFDTQGIWQSDAARCVQLADFFRARAEQGRQVPRPFDDDVPVTLQFAAAAEVDAFGAPSAEIIAAVKPWAVWIP